MFEKDTINVDGVEYVRKEPKIGLDSGCIYVDESIFGKRTIKLNTPMRPYICGVEVEEFENLIKVLEGDYTDFQIKYRKGSNYFNPAGLEMTGVFSKELPLALAVVLRTGLNNLLGEEQDESELTPKQVVQKMLSKRSVAFPFGTCHGEVSFVLYCGPYIKRADDMYNYAANYFKDSVIRWIPACNNWGVGFKTIYNLNDDKESPTGKMHVVLLKVQMK